MFKICFKYLIFLENINIGQNITIGHISHGIIFGPPKFLEKKWTYIYYIFVYTFENDLIC